MEERACRVASGERLRSKGSSSYAGAAFPIEERDREGEWDEILVSGGEINGLSPRQG